MTFTNSITNSLTKSIKIALLSIILVSCSTGDSDDNNTTGPGQQPGVSNDPAIRDSSLDLVVKSGWFYENIKTEALSQTREAVTRTGSPVACNCKLLCPACWKSDSYVKFGFNAEKGRMKQIASAVLYDEVQANYLDYWNSIFVIAPLFSEHTIGRTTLMREFTVEPGDTPGKALAGSVIRFNVQWLGRLLSVGLDETSYEVRFLLRDLTENRVKIDQKLGGNSIKGKVKVMAVKGVPIPIIIPGWGQDRTEDERHAFPIPLLTGHTYRLQVSLKLEANTGLKGNTLAWFDTNAKALADGITLGGFTDTGFLDFKNIDLDIGN